MTPEEERRIIEQAITEWMPRQRQACRLARHREITPVNVQRGYLVLQRLVCLHCGAVHDPEAN